MRNNLSYMSDARNIFAALFCLFAAASCGGGGGGSPSPPPPPPPPAGTPAPGQVSALATPFAAACGSGAGTLYPNAEVEPYLAVNPVNPSNMVGVWQQDRWSNGSARGTNTGVTFDGGATWAYRQLPFSVCAGGTFARATDPWVSFGPTGIAYQMALGSTGGTFGANGQNAMLASRSLDGGLTWSAPATLILDGGGFFNDKNTLTADPTDARFVYAAWDRLAQNGGGPAYFARSIDSGATWETARSIFDQGTCCQTLGGLVVVLPDGTLVYVFTLLFPIPPDNRQGANAMAMRSTDKGLTWTTPVLIGNLLAVGASDPQSGAAIRDGSILAQAAVGATSIFVVWQDARFTGGVRDAIALSRSIDGGLTWSAPLRVNGDLSVAAFTPQVHVMANGTIGLTYFDLRSNTADAATLFTDYWLARSTDGVAWTEARVTAPFDLATAPNAEGLFLGDYMALASAGTTFLPFYVRTTGDLTNRTDVFLTRVAATPALKSTLATGAPGFIADAELERRVAENIGRVMQRRVPGWKPR